MTRRDGEENQEINDILVIEKRIQNESRPMKPTETEIPVRVETKITDEERRHWWAESFDYKKWSRTVSTFQKNSSKKVVWCN